MDESKISILLADDHPLIRDALRNVLEEEDDFEIIGEASDGEEAVQLATRFATNVVIMDINMPKLTGLEATRQIKEKCPNTEVIVLTIYDDSEHILAILESGASGYMTKSVFGKDVIQAVRGVAAGEMVLTPEVLKKILKHALSYSSKTVPIELGGKITVRELNILQLLARGKSNKDIAQMLNIATRTVKGYLEQIFSKLNASNRTEAVIIALRADILNLGDLD